MPSDPKLAIYTRPTLIEIVAPHCVECRAMQPDLDAVAEANDDVDLVVVDATREAETVASMRVLGTPTLIAVNDGVEIARVTGRRSRAELQELFTAVATGEADSISSVSRSDRIVWSGGGALVAGVGLLLGPFWALVAVGGGLVVFANWPRRRMSNIND